MLTLIFIKKIMTPTTGLHMIDYEQLKIENQTYNEKVEERNEDLLKFNAKINSTGLLFFYIFQLLFNLLFKSKS